MRLIEKSRLTFELSGLAFEELELPYIEIRVPRDREFLEGR